MYNLCTYIILEITVNAIGIIVLWRLFVQNVLFDNC